MQRGSVACAWPWCSLYARWHGGSARRVGALCWRSDELKPGPFAGLLRYPLPSQVRVHLCFAQAGDQVHDYTEGLLVQLGEQIARYYQHSQPVRGDARLQNFWQALISADAYFAFQKSCARWRIAVG